MGLLSMGSFGSDERCDCAESRPGERAMSPYHNPEKAKSSQLYSFFVYVRTKDDINTRRGCGASSSASLYCNT